MSKLARALVLGPMLAAMNLAGMTAVAQARPTTKARTPGGRPPNAKWGSPGAIATSHQGVSRPRTRPPSGRLQGSGTGITSRRWLRESRQPSCLVAASRRAGADHLGRRPPSAAGPRALLHPQRDTRPAARPSADQIQWTARVAPRFTWRPGRRPGAGGRAGRARRQTGRPQSPSRARGLTTVTVRPPCRRWVVGIPCPQATASRPCAGPDEVVRTHPLAPDGCQ
jgi:hypothetical protein